LIRHTSDPAIISKALHVSELPQILKPQELQHALTHVLYADQSHSHHEHDHHHHEGGHCGATQNIGATLMVPQMPKALKATISSTIECIPMLMARFLDLKEWFAGVALDFLLIATTPIKHRVKAATLCATVQHPLIEGLKVHRRPSSPNVVFLSAEPFMFFSFLFMY
jgi:hypothetical protein